jgi:multidrug efflux pump subunit AcrA (membrane-fusion protein)
VACHVVARDPSASVINGLSRFWVSIAPDNPDPRLLAGVPVDVRITTGQATNVVAVPNQAVYVLDGQPHVDVWFKNHAVATVVTTGPVGSELTQVKSGIAPGQQVVLAGSNGLPPAASHP